MLPAPAASGARRPDRRERRRTGARSRWRATGSAAVVDAGSRVGVETIPALERAGAIALVASADDRGARGAARFAGLIDRLGLGEVPCGVIAARCGRDQRLARALAAGAALPLWGVVPARRAIGHAAAQGAAPPAGPFARAAAGVREAAA